MRNSEPYKIGYDEGFEDGFIRAVELVNFNKILSKGLKKLMIKYMEYQKKASSKSEGKGEI